MSSVSGTTITWHSSDAITDAGFQVLTTKLNEISRLKRTKLSTCLYTKLQSSSLIPGFEENTQTRRGRLTTHGRAKNGTGKPRVAKEGLFTRRVLGETQNVFPRRLPLALSLSHSLGGGLRDSCQCGETRAHWPAAKGCTPSGEMVQQRPPVSKGGKEGISRRRKQCGARVMSVICA